MAREYWYFLAGMLAVLLPLAALFAVKKLDLLEPRADHRLVYKLVGDRELALHVFKAAPAGDAPAPALLLFHGGGWAYGYPRDLYPQCQFLASHGITCVSADYRLGPPGRPDIEGMLQDAADALLQLRGSAAELAIDASRISVGGASAGAHIAALLGIRAARKPAGLVLFNPILDLSPGEPHHYLFADNWRDVSPLQKVTTGVPATLVLVGDRDTEVPLKTVNGFCAAMQEAGNRCEEAIYEKQEHGFFRDRPGGNPWFDRTNERVLAFLQDNRG